MHWELEVWLARALEAAMSPRADNDDVEMMGGGPVKNLAWGLLLPSCPRSLSSGKSK